MEIFGETISRTELFGTIFGLLGVWLTVRQKIWCFPMGIINVGLYAIVFYDSRLYADMCLQLIYIVLLIYGWIRWNEHKREGFVASYTSFPLFALLLSVAAVFTFFFGRILSVYTNASLPYLDSSLAALSLVAQWMIAKKKIENWLLWIFVDVVYVGMYIFKNLYMTAFLYAVFIPLAVAGWRAWKKNLVPDEA